MTNSEIIISEIKGHELMTDEQIVEFIKEHAFLPLNTYAEWKRLGYVVKRGEHATITSKLWRFTDKKKKGTWPKTELDKSAEKQDNGRYYLAKAFLFTSEQVQKLA